MALGRQRLRGLVGSYPQRLDLCERLAEVYRGDGDLAQAGRWSYLSPSVDAAEVAAFERAYGGDAVLMMRALSWRATEDEAATETARERLRALRARAEEEAGGPVDWLDPRRPDPPQTWWGDLVKIVALVLLLFGFSLLVVGLGSLLGRGWDVMRGWF